MPKVNDALEHLRAGKVRYRMTHDTGPDCIAVRSFCG
jgi:hypothetical protein